MSKNVGPTSQLADPSFVVGKNCPGDVRGVTLEPVVGLTIGSLAKRGNFANRFFGVKPAQKPNALQICEAFKCCSNIAINSGM